MNTPAAPSPATALARIGNVPAPSVAAAPGGSDPPGWLLPRWSRWRGAARGVALVGACALRPAVGLERFTRAAARVVLGRGRPHRRRLRLRARRGPLRPLTPDAQYVVSRGRNRALQVVELRRELSLLPVRVDPGRGLPPDRSGRRRPPPARVRSVRQPLHHLRARGGASDHGAQARWEAGALRPPEAAPRAREGGEQAAGHRRAARGARRLDRRRDPRRRARGAGRADRRAVAARRSRAWTRLRRSSSRPFTGASGISTSSRRRFVVSRRSRFRTPISSLSRTRIRPTPGAVSVVPPQPPPGRTKKLRRTGESMSDSRSSTAPQAGQGVTVERYYTEPGVHPFDAVEWEIRDALIGDPGVARLLAAGRRVPGDAGRRTRPTSSPRSTSAGGWAPTSASTRSSR